MTKKRGHCIYINCSKFPVDISIELKSECYSALSYITLANSILQMVQVNIYVNKLPYNYDTVETTHTNTHNVHKML